jgi:hypothetical protein
MQNEEFKMQARPGGLRTGVLPEAVLSRRKMGHFRPLDTPCFAGILSRSVANGACGTGSSAACRAETI